MASGDPVTGGFVLGARLAPKPLQGSGMPRESVPVLWEGARDERFSKTVHRGQTLAVPRFGRSVHVDVSGLQLNR